MSFDRKSHVVDNRKKVAIYGIYAFLTILKSRKNPKLRACYYYICFIQMSHFTSEDEALLQSMLRQLLQSVKEKITGAPSVECAEEILLHLEETDENFHK